MGNQGQENDTIYRILWHRFSKGDWTVVAGITSLSLMLELMPNDVSEGNNVTFKMVETEKGLNAFEVKKRIALMKAIFSNFT